MSFFYSLTDFFQYDFLLYALIATMALSIGAGILSPIIVAKRYAFMGAAVSHSTLFGLSISLAFFQASEISHFFVTLLITLSLIMVLSTTTYRQKLPTDSLIGVFFTVTMALGIVIYSLFSSGDQDLIGFLFGNILLLTPFDLIALLSISVGVLLSTVFINLLPEISEHHYTLLTAYSILGGFLMMFVIEKFIIMKLFFLLKKNIS